MTPLPSFLLDTCAVLWITNDDPLLKSATSALHAAFESGDSVFVSPITAWELGMLAARGRLAGAISAQKVFQIIRDSPGTALAGLPPSVFLDSSFLPGEPPNDSADRIIIATAREFGLRIVTRDRRILDYADQGHVQALAC